ncbi:hypothetical protein HAX54_042772, partial [Datura stramonium]|nr:hypothetical protein [Datura stramonium]
KFQGIPLKNEEVEPSKNVIPPSSTPILNHFTAAQSLDRSRDLAAAALALA